MSELKITFEHDILKITKGNGEPIIFNENDIEHLNKCARKVFHEDPAKTNVLLIANDNDEEAAFKIQNALDSKYGFSTTVYNDEQWRKSRKKDSKTINSTPQISIGGPEYNNTTKYIENNSKMETLVSLHGYTIKMGEKDIVIYGYESPEQTMLATNVFLDSKMLDYYVHCFRQYLEKIAPKKKPPKDKEKHEKVLVEPKPEETEPPKNEANPTTDNTEPQIKDDPKPEPIEPPIKKNQIYSINDFSVIRAKINKFKQAIPEFDLIFKKTPSKYSTIKFNDRSDFQFSLLLFLVIERTNKKSNWLDMTFTNLKKQSHFVNLINFCGLQKIIENKEGWWDDSYNKRKKGYVLQINKKVRQECHLQEDIIVRHLSLKGVYCLNDKIEAVTVNDL